MLSVGALLGLLTERVRVLKARVVLSGERGKKMKRKKNWKQRDYINNLIPLFQSLGLRIVTIRLFKNKNPSQKMPRGGVYPPSFATTGCRLQL